MAHTDIRDESVRLATPSPPCLTQTSLVDLSVSDPITSVAHTNSIGESVLLATLIISVAYNDITGESVRVVILITAVAHTGITDEPVGLASLITSVAHTDIRDESVCEVTPSSPLWLTRTSQMSLLV